MGHTVLFMNRNAMIALLILVLAYSPLFAQAHTVGLIRYDAGTFEGYILFSPNFSTTTYLIDNYGRLVHSWQATSPPSLSVYLLENGYLLRTMNLAGSGTAGGGFQEIAWDGTVVWEYEYYSDDYLQHHDIEPLPNGHVLVLAREYKTAAEMIAAGRDPLSLNVGEVFLEHIVEVEPTGPTTGNIVWEWHIWDHLIQDFDPSKSNYGDVEEQPELLDINFTAHKRSDWLHVNSVAYNADLDQIVISSRTLCEIYVIDHSTTTAEAAGHSGGNSGKGGDIMYRWGNPQSYHRGTPEDQQLFGQHDAHWIAPGLSGEGNILIFNNGEERPGDDYSSVDEIVPPVDAEGNYLLLPDAPYGPAEPTWSFTTETPSDFYSYRIGGAQRLPNGNTLICSGSDGVFLEVTNDGEIIWKYVSPVAPKGILSQGEIPSGNEIFRCYRYAHDYPGLESQTLVPSGVLEVYPSSISGTSHYPEAPTTFHSVVVTATITDDDEIVTAELYADTGQGFFATTMFDDGNHSDGQAGDDLYGALLPPMPESTIVSYYVRAVNDLDSITSDPPLAPATTYWYIVEAGSYVCGDADFSSEVDIDDVVYLITYIFSAGPAPVPLLAGDPNCSGEVDIDDVVYLVTYIFSGGNAPCDTNGDSLPDC
jgi:hypothetical protein